MSKTTTETSAPAWELPVPTADFLARHPETDVDEWRSLITTVIDIATRESWSKAEVARRIGLSDGTFSPWAFGKYTGVLANISRTVALWVQSYEESAGMAAVIQSSPSFLKTHVASEVWETLQWAQMTTALVMVTLPAGVGKTETCRRYASTRPHTYLSTMSPNTKTVHGMLTELAGELDVQEHNPAKLARAIGRKLQRTGGGTLLIVDEAQNLVPEAVNQLRHFVDINRCGVALIGNKEIADRFERQGSTASKDQVTSRFDKRVQVERNRDADLRQFIAAWGVVEADCVAFLVGIGMKGGALRQVDRTLKLASMYAAGAGSPITLKFLKEAWRNRNVGDWS